MIRSLIIAAGIAVSIPTAANSAVVSLNFEGIAPFPNANNVFVGEFYNGGTSSIGTSGTNFGVSFSSNSLLLCLNDLNVRCSNASRGGQAPGSEEGALFFLGGVASILNIAAGFNTGFSFNYTSLTQPGTVSVFDGLEGTGNLLTSFSIAPNAVGCPNFGAGFCPFGQAGGSFNGIAKSIVFAGVANQIGFDDITFGSATPVVTPNAVPEPATWAMMIAGFGLVGGAMRRRAVKVTYA